MCLDITVHLAGHARGCLRLPGGFQALLDEPLPHALSALEARPEADNLVVIYAALAGLSREAALARFAGQNFSTFKEALSEVAVVPRVGNEATSVWAQYTIRLKPGVRDTFAAALKAELAGA